MTATLAIAIAALVVAMIAFAYARRMGRKLAMLEQLYWQLKFEHGELKAKVDPSSGAGPETQPNFIPLTRLRQGSGEASSLKQ